MHIYNARENQSQIFHFNNDGISNRKIKLNLMKSEISKHEILRDPKLCTDLKLIKFYL